MGNLDLAIDYVQRMLDLSAQMHAPAEASRAHRYLSDIYDALGDGPEAGAHAEAALRLAAGVPEPALRIFALESLAHSQRRAGKFSEARRNLETVRAYWAAAGSRWNAANSVRDLADVAEAEGNLTAALAGYEAARAEMQAVGDQRGLARACYHEASLLRRLGRTDEAMERLVRGRSLVTGIGGHQLLSEFHAELARVRELKGDLAGALADERVAAAERDALVGERARMRAADFEARLVVATRQRELDEMARKASIEAAALREREAELRAHTAELARSLTLRWAVLGAALLGAGALGAVVLAQRARLRAEHRLHIETRFAKETAEEADRVKTRFLGIASHDIRGPVGNIVNLAELLRGSAAGAPGNQADLDLIAAEGRRVLALLEDLLTHAALEAGQLALQLAPLDLAAVARSVIASLAWQARAKQQTLGLTESAPGAGRMVGDADRLYQVVANLVSNAIKFTPPGRTVDVAVTGEGGRVILTVRDEGPGMSPEVQARLFTPFTRLAARPTGGEFSHGLGLSISHEIVGLHGGRIRVQSAPGAGSTFIVELPAAAPVLAG
jgi:signal transduction histidine kinase